MEDSMWETYTKAAAYPVLKGKIILILLYIIIYSNIRSVTMRNINNRNSPSQILVSCH